jgi:hypothetical protein
MPENIPQEEEFNITFKNGALKRLKALAADLGVPQSRLGDVLSKGISLMDIAREGNNVVIKKGKEEYLIDLRLL